MKLEFTMAVKAVPMADVRVNIDCSAEELSVMLSDPVYQDLGRALVAKLQQSNRPTERRQRDQANQHRQQNRRNDRNDRLAEVHRKQSAAVQKVKETIEKRFNAMKNNKPQWGEL